MRHLCNGNSVGQMWMSLFLCFGLFLLAIEFRELILFGPNYSKRMAMCRCFSIKKFNSSLNFILFEVRCNLNERNSIKKHKKTIAWVMWGEKELYAKITLIKSNNSKIVKTNQKSSQPICFWMCFVISQFEIFEIRNDLPRSSMPFIDQLQMPEFRISKKFLCESLVIWFIKVFSHWYFSI